MPYVPSVKTDGKSQDRVNIDKAVEAAAEFVDAAAPNNFGLLFVYKDAFRWVGNFIHSLVLYGPDWKPEFDECDDTPAVYFRMAAAVYQEGNKYGYDGAFLGEFNYAITRLIQRVPKLKVASGEWKDELRYWLYADTVQALTWASHWFVEDPFGIGGVFEDVKDEYKRRVNTAYEAAQIVKSGDCYDTPYYTRLVEVLDPDGAPIGHVEVMLKRSEGTLGRDVLDGKLLLFPTPPKFPSCISG